MSTPEELIESCVSLVHHLARQYAAQNTNISLEDLISEGYIGLVQAAHKFEEGRGVKFSTFASARIRGAMMDSMRRSRPVSRPMAEKIAQVITLSENTTARKGREPTQAEVARKLHLSAAKAGEVMRMRSLRLTSLEAHAEDLHHEFADQQDTPEDLALQIVLRQELRSLVDRLRPRDREIIYRIYWLRQKHSKVAKELGISESRVSQLQSRALNRLRRMLAEDGLQAA
jgi:RNA polymerase sigma factor for flagellar operon FliA